MYHEHGLKNPAIMVDANHANSGKKYLEQIRICKEVLHSKKFSEDIGHMVKGVTVEELSLRTDASLSIVLVYGQSITDPCLGWEKTEKLICELADMVD